MEDLKRYIWLSLSYMLGGTIGVFGTSMYANVNDAGYFSMVTSAFMVFHISMLYSSNKKSRISIGWESFLVWLTAGGLAQYTERNMMPGIVETKSTLNIGASSELVGGLMFSVVAFVVVWFIHEYLGDLPAVVLGAWRGKAVKSALKEESFRN